MFNVLMCETQNFVSRDVAKLPFVAVATVIPNYVSNKHLVIKLGVLAYEVVKITRTIVVVVLVASSH